MDARGFMGWVSPAGHAVQIPSPLDAGFNLGARSQLRALSGHDRPRAEQQSDEICEHPERQRTNSIVAQFECRSIFFGTNTYHGRRARKESSCLKLQSSKRLKSSTLEGIQLWP